MTKNYRPRTYNKIKTGFSTNSILHRMVSYILNRKLVLVCKGASYPTCKSQLRKTLHGRGGNTRVTIRISLETGMDFQTTTKAGYVTNCYYRHRLCIISKHLEGYLLCLWADKNKSSSFSHQCLTNYKKTPNTAFIWQVHIIGWRGHYRRNCSEKQDIARSARRQWTDRYPNFDLSPSSELLFF